MLCMNLTNCGFVSSVDSRAIQASLLSLRRKDNNEQEKIGVGFSV